MVMNKSDLIAFVSNNLRLPMNRAEDAVNGVFDAMTAALVRGERIEIRGLGSWVPKQYGAKNGRNPKTGEPISVPPKRLPYFKAGKPLADRIMAAWQREQAEAEP